MSVCGPQESPWESSPQDIKKSVQMSLTTEAVRANKELTGYIYLILPLIFVTPAGGTQGVN